MKNPINRVTSTILVGLLALAGGCAVPGHYEGGSLKSLDKGVYESTTWQPKTVTLVDTRNGETLKSWEVPVGKRLIMRFYRNTSDNPAMPDTVRWTMAEAQTHWSTLENGMDVPRSSERRIDVQLRPAPEQASAGSN